MKILTPLATALLLSVASFAQQNFQQGYIVNVSGDTIKGRIDNLIWDESPRQLTFVGPSGSSTYKATDIAAFGAGSHTFYRSFKVRIDTTGGIGGDVANAPSPTYLEDIVFLKVLVDGNTSLLKYKKGFRTHYFIHEKGSTPEEIIRHASSLIVAGQTLGQPGNQYIAQLKDKMNDCPNLTIDLGMKYMEKPLIDLFEQYNKCKSSPAKIPGNEPKRVSLGVVVAAHYDSFEGDYDHGIGYSGGVFFEIIYPKKIYKTSWYNEIVYYKYGKQSSKASEFDFGAVKLTTMVKTRVSAGPMKPYVLFGISRVLAANTSRFVISNQSYSGQIDGHWALAAGFGMFITDALSADLRVDRTTPILFTTGKQRSGGITSVSGDGPNYSWLVGLSLAYRLKSF